jgi:flagellar protein FlaG
MDIQLPATSPQAPPAAERGIRIAPSIVLDKKAELGVDPNVAVQATKPVPDEQEVTQALKSINEVLKARSPDLEFSVDSDSNRSVVKVVDKNTQEVIRQMPTKEALEIAKALDRLQSMLIRDSA